MKKYGMTNGQGYILRIGLKIKFLHIKKLKQINLADFTDINVSWIVYIEREAQNFTVETLYKITNVLNVWIKDLLDVD